MLEVALPVPGLAFKRLGSFSFHSWKPATTLQESPAILLEKSHRGGSVREGSGGRGRGAGVVMWWKGRKWKRGHTEGHEAPDM